MSEINRIRNDTKKNGMSREVRIAEINLLLNSGFEPNEHELSALANLILYEELTNKNPDKMTVEVYPIMSDYQLARRQTGKHRKKAKKDDMPIRLEVPLSWAENYGNDGKNYSYPNKRKRDDYENEWIDEIAQSHNKETRDRYNAFVKGKVVRGESGRFKRVFSNGVFTVDIKTGIKTIHTREEL